MRGSGKRPFEMEEERKEALTEEKESKVGFSQKQSSWGEDMEVSSAE